MPRPLPDILPIRWPAGTAAPPPDTEAALDRAARLLVEGGLVAIPTETVYGLAARADAPEAVGRIFAAKGRPQTNPLIVHVADEAMARRLASAWPDTAARITAQLWPGPVTVVVPRGETIPDEVTAGGDTVALRCPEHPLTRRLIEKAGVPLAAPSANRSLAVSPTTAAHVLESLGNRIDLILDGGPCSRGIESTVVDCSASPPRILRPGPVGHEQLEAILGAPPAIATEPSGDASASVARSPGMMARHYAPKTPLVLASDAAARVAELLASGKRVGWLTRAAEIPETRRLAASKDLLVIPMPDDPDAFAARLYATLHALDKRELATIVVDEPPPGDAWRAVRDRLTRAATK
ncbi:MAG: L-threonylcarbamoyladenylate synthase [Planctomycetia bacterium]|jgi:L-threonylcarbamoyladenylate synthase